MKNRANAKERIREERTKTMDMFAGHQATVQEATIDEIVEAQMYLASADLMASLDESSVPVFACTRSPPSGPDAA